MEILGIIIIALQLSLIGFVSYYGVLKFINRNKPKICGLPYIPFPDEEPPRRIRKL